MRILHVLATGGRRGGETFASDLIGALQGEGVAQSVLVLTEPVEISFPSAVELSTLDLRPSQLRGLGFSLSARAQLRAALGRASADVVLAHGGDALKQLWWARWSIPLVYRRIGEVSPSSGMTFRNLFFRRQLERPVKVVAVAEAVKRQLTAGYGVSAERVEVIPNGVSLERLMPSRSARDVRADLGVPPRRLLVMTVASVSRDKDPLTHLEIVMRTLRQRPDVFFVWVGGGEMLAEVRALVADHDPAFARFVGWRTDVADLIAAADVVLHASPSEGMPATLIEAGVLGVPSIAFDVGGVSEIVRHEITGLVCRKGDIDAATRALSLLAERPALRAKLGEAARSDYPSRFDIMRIASRYAVLLREVARA